MTYLLDTYTLIWTILEPEKLSAKARMLIEAREQRIVVSAISLWEISIKFSLGKLLLQHLEPDQFPDLCRQLDIELLPLTGALCASFHRLKATHHRDPFDRLLLWTAKFHGYTLISNDAMLKLYSDEGISVLW